MTKYKNIHRSESTGLGKPDYTSPGFYFITIYTKNYKWYFGVIESESDGDTKTVAQNFASLRPSPIGEIANRYWLEIPNHFPFIILDTYVVMPNHIHGILQIKKTDYPEWNKNSPVLPSKNLASVIRRFRAAVRKYATLNNIEFFWHRLFHHQVITSQQNLIIIRKYINDSPENWITKKDV
jgi:REP element-mobilizing transposase RayT